MPVYFKGTSPGLNKNDLVYRPLFCNPTKLTFSLHSHLKAFPQTAELAPVTMMFVDNAVLLTATAVGQILPHTALKKTFTPLTADGSVVTP